MRLSTPVRVMHRLAKWLAPMGLNYAQACKAVAAEPELATEIGVDPVMVRQAVAELEDPWARAVYEAERQILDPEVTREPTVSHDLVSVNQLRLWLNEMAQDPDVGHLVVVLGSELKPLKLVSMGVVRQTPVCDEDYCVVLSP